MESHVKLHDILFRSILKFSCHPKYFPYLPFYKNIHVVYIFTLPFTFVFTNTAVSTYEDIFRLNLISFLYSIHSIELLLKFNNSLFTCPVVRSKLPTPKARCFMVGNIVDHHRSLTVFHFNYYYVNCPTTLCKDILMYLSRKDLHFILYISP